MSEKLEARTRLNEEYHAYTKECRRKWQYQMSYEQWVSYELIKARAERDALQAKLDAALAIEDARCPTDDGYDDERDTGHDEGYNKCRDEFRKALRAED